MSLRLFLASFALATAPLMATAHHTEKHGAEADLHAIGPVLDAPAPALAAIMTDGTPATFEALSGEQGTIIAFVRSADWCPYCQRQLVELSKADETISKTGWQVVGLSYDSAETLKAFGERSSISFPLLSDEGSETIKAYGLLNEEHEPGSRVYGIPHPALVFVRKDGTVAAVLREEGYRERPEIDVITSKITELNAIN